MKKKNSMRWHTKKNIRKRYGIFASSDVYFAIQDMVKNHQGVIIEKQSNTRLLVRVCVPVKIACQDKRTSPKVPIEDGCIKMYFVYNTKYKELNTVLPWYKSDSEMLEDYYKNHYYERG